MFRSTFPVLVFLALSLPLGAQDKVTSEVKSDLDDAQKRLTAQRESQATGRRKLSEEITARQQELLVTRRQTELSRRSIADQEAFIHKLRNKGYASKSEVQTLGESLRSFGVQQFANRLPGQSDDPRYDGALNPNPDENAALLSRLSVLEAAIEHLENALGATTNPAQASDEDSKLISGEVLSFGPVHYFQSDDKSLAGSYHLSRSKKVATLDEEDAEAAKALFSGKEAEVRIDITAGKARALAGIKSDPLSLIKKGGAWVYPIIFLAFAALFCAAKKFFELRRIKDPEDQNIEQLADLFLAGNKHDSSQQAEAIRHPIANVLPETMKVLVEGKTDLGEEILYARLISVKESLRRWLPFIAVTAATAPLLGLLGTVSGLIKTFSIIAVEGTGEAQSISGGISEALITTLFGLTVAIPAFMAHALLSRRARGIEQNTERLGLVFLNAVRKHQVNSQQPPK